MDYQVEENINVVLSGFERKKEQMLSKIREHSVFDDLLLDDIRSKLDEIYIREINRHSEFSKYFVDLSVIFIDLKSLRQSIYSRKDIPPTLLVKYKKRIDSLKEDLQLVKESLQTIKLSYETRLRFLNSAQFIVRDMNLN